MRSIESEGDTIDQAIERALRALDVARDQVQIEILSDATRGLLGFGGKAGRILRPASAENRAVFPMIGTVVGGRPRTASTVKTHREKNKAKREPAPQI